MISLRNGPTTNNSQSLEDAQDRKAMKYLRVKAKVSFLMNLSLLQGDPKRM